jgi:hypothetical protein
LGQQVAQEDLQHSKYFLPGQSRQSLREALSLALQLFLWFLVAP